MTDLERYEKARAKLCEVRDKLFYIGTDHLAEKIHIIWEDLAMWLAFDEDCGLIE